jgi:hypothetical protein
MKKKTKLTAEFWQRDRENKRALAERVAELKRQIAARKAAEQQL